MVRNITTIFFVLFLQIFGFAAFASANTINTMDNKIVLTIGKDNYTRAQIKKIEETNKENLENTQREFSKKGIKFKIEYKPIKDNMAAYVTKLEKENLILVSYKNNEQDMTVKMASLTKELSKVNIALKEAPKEVAISMYSNEKNLYEGKINKEKYEKNLAYMIAGITIVMFFVCATLLYFQQKHINSFVAGQNLDTGKITIVDEKKASDDVENKLIKNIVSNINRELEDKLEEISSLKEKITEKEAEIQDLNCKISVLVDENRVGKKNFDEKSAFALKLERRIADLQSSEENLEELKNRLSALTKITSQYNTDIKVEQDKYRALELRFNKSNVEAIRSLENLTKENQSLKEEILSLGSKNNILEIESRAVREGKLTKIEFNPKSQAGEEKIADGNGTSA